MFCVECGKEGPIFRNGSCVSCYLKTKQFSKGPEYLDIHTCSTCGAYKHKNTWVSEPFETILHRLIREEFTISPELRNIRISTSCEQQDKILKCMVKITGVIDDFEITEDHPLIVRLRKETCEVCSRQAGGYYEAILQIRRDKRKFSKQELDVLKQYVESFIENAQAKGNKALFITDIAEEHGGLNYYLSEKGSAFTLAKKLYEQYGGELKQSARNAGMKDSKQLFRMTYLIRLPEYQKGDFIRYQENVYYISSLHEATIHAVELSSWTKRVFTSKEFQNARVLGGEELIMEMILVSQSNDEMQVMDQKNFRTFTLKKPKNMVFSEKTVKVLMVDDQYFVLPEKKP
ncbi:MAG: NMD3-related protein [Methanobacteriota archaeon]